ncbi:MAG: hypothetical protein JW966_13670 [Anaerolineae bacterium]|nr:hypothetical protein [Anaerolineae bacterium]
MSTDDPKDTNEEPLDIIEQPTEEVSLSDNDTLTGQDTVSLDITAEPVEEAEISVDLDVGDEPDTDFDLDTSDESDDDFDLDTGDEPDDDFDLDASDELDAGFDLDAGDEPETPADEPTEPDMFSAAPPRIVAETPVGAPVARLAGTAPDLAFEQPDTPVQPAETEAPEIDADVVSATKETQEAAAVTTPAGETTPALVRSESPVSPETEISAEMPEPELADIVPEEDMHDVEALNVAIVTAAEGTAPAPAVEPSTVRTWEDDEISPELASILNATPAAAPPAPAPEAVPPAAPAPAVESLPTPPPPADAIRLTNAAQVRTLPVTAAGISSPAPEDQPGARMRYQRVEEPLSKNKGQRTVEQWKFLGPEYPIVGGRPVRQVDIEELAYSDGSWHWSFERRYTDKGYDRRDVRAAADTYFIERKDEIRKKDVVSGKFARQKEQVAMIYTSPQDEEKRGFFSALLARGDDDEDDVEEKWWREATSKESRHARRHGGDAF